MQSKDSRYAKELAFEPNTIENINTVYIVARAFCFFKESFFKIYTSNNMRYFIDYYLFGIFFSSLINKFKIKLKFKNSLIYLIIYLMVLIGEKRIWLHLLFKISLYI